MSYYILPKKHIKIEINPTLLTGPPVKLKPVISQSIVSYLSETETNLSNLSPIEYSIEFIRKIANPYEFIFSKVPGSKFSVSKLKPFSNTFYVIYELFSTFNLLESMTNRNITAIHYAANSAASIECLSMFREDKNDINYSLELTNNFATNGLRPNSADFLYFEINSGTSIGSDIDTSSDYIIELIVVVCNILSYQNSQGICIIKVDTLFYKPVLDILFILTGLYDKVSIIKPNTSDINNNDRYLVCKHFNHNSSQNNCSKMTENFVNLLNEVINNKYFIHSLIKSELPYYFLNKVEDSNIIIAHQQIEFMDQIISLVKHKNRMDKIESLKKTNIQKCIQWCEKFKIPNNKFAEKVNIFLPIVIYDEHHLLDDDAVIKLNDDTDNDNTIENKKDANILTDLVLVDSNDEACIHSMM